MESARKSLFRQIVIRFSILVSVLLVIFSGVWLFFLRDQLLQAGISDAKVISSLMLVSRFIVVLIVVISVIVVLIGLIFTDGFKTGFLDLIKQVAGLKEAPFGSRVEYGEKNELNDLAAEVNQLVEKFEKEVARDLTSAADEHQHYVEEQSRVGFEQKKIFEEKEKLEFVLARIKDGVIMLGRQRNVVRMNKAAEELTGYKQLEAGGKLIRNVLRFFEEEREIMPEEYAPQMQTGALKDEAFIKKRVRIESAQATEKFVDLVCVRLTLIQTQDLGYMIVLHDLTARFEIERKRTELLGSFANDLKQPLNIISTSLDNDNLNPQSAQSGAAYLSVIVENLLTAGAIEDGSISINMEQVDLAEVVRNAYIILQPIAAGRQVSLQMDEPKDFSAVVNGNQSRMFQVVMNLLVNAICFTGAGGSVSISFTQADGDVILQIQDTGIGIPTENMKDLFNKFSVIPNSKGFDTGMGLGLYVCRKLMELQNGKIWMDSVEGRGTVVSVSLQKASN